MCMYMYSIMRINMVIDIEHPSTHPIIQPMFVEYLPCGEHCVEARIKAHEWTSYKADRPETQ